LELVSGIERRRRWRIEEKLRIVAEAEAPGAVFAAVARRHDISRGLLWIWRQQMRRGELRAASFQAEFMPVNVIANTSDARVSASASMPITRPETVDIILPDGTCLRVNAAIDATSLRRLLGVLRG
jgi:transposase